MTRDWQEEWRWRERERVVKEKGKWKGGRRDVLKTRISRIKTMKPRTPPLVPYFQVLSWVVAERVSSATAKETRRRLSRIEENIFGVVEFD
jgi:hypothetical protein